jgi:ParB-like chromosome segregation protein Spo0J
VSELQYTIKLASGKSWRDYLPIHPDALRFDPLTAEELKKLADSISKDKLQVPIAIIETENGMQLLDGIQRMDASELSGVTVFTPDMFKIMPPDTDPRAAIIAFNINRRHLSPKDKDRLTELLLNSDPQQSDRAIAKKVGRSDKTVTKKRKAMVARSEIPHVEERKDTKGRAQPAKKPKRTISPERQAHAEQDEKVVVNLAREDLDAGNKIINSGEWWTQESKHIAAQMAKHFTIKKISELCAMAIDLKKAKQAQTVKAAS